MFAKVVLSSIVLLVVVKCSPYKDGERKCVPTQWESLLFGQVIADYNGQGEVLLVAGSYSVDHENKKLVITESKYFQGKHISSYSVYNSMEDTVGVDLMKKECVILPHDPFERLCSDSPVLEYAMSWTAGSQTLDAFYAKDDGKVVTFVFRRDNFELVTQTVLQDEDFVPAFKFTQFANSTTGIKDPNVFTLPSYCDDKIKEMFEK